MILIFTPRLNYFIVWNYMPESEMSKKLDDVKMLNDSRTKLLSYMGEKEIQPTSNENENGSTKNKCRILGIIVLLIFEYFCIFYLVTSQLEEKYKNPVIYTIVFMAIFFLFCTIHTSFWAMEVIKRMKESSIRFNVQHSDQGLLDTMV